MAVPGRLSKNRAGTKGLIALLSGNQPVTSMMRWVDDEVKMLILPLSPTLAMTRFGMVWPAVKLRLDATGISAPVGQTVAKPGLVASTMVTFTTTAPTP